MAKGLTLGVPGRAPFERGDLIYRSVSDVRGAAGLPETFISVFTGVVVAVGSVVILALIHVSFVIAWALCFLVATVATKHVFRDLASRHSMLSSHSGRMVTVFLDALRGARTIQASNTVEREAERICKPLVDVADGARDLQISAGKGMAVMLLSSRGVVIAATCVGAVLLTKDAITLGMFVAALAYSQQAISAASGIVDNGWFHIAIGRNNAHRVDEVLAAKEATPDPRHPKRFPASGPASVNWNGVGLQTAEQGALLRKVHLSVPARKTLALVGASGVGKTTLVGFVGRLSDPDEGRVSIADTPVTAVARRELARRVAYAFERPKLIGTVQDSIALGRPATAEAVRIAAARAHADEFIERLPKGYATPVSELRISGGESQRLGLARAFLELDRTGVLVLDDATSHLDMATEARISRSLLVQGRSQTIVIVAHRASMAARADTVAWLHDGTIEAIGSHQDLLANPAYRELFDVA